MAALGRFTTEARSRREHTENGTACLRARGRFLFSVPFFFVSSVSPWSNLVWAVCVKPVPAFWCRAPGSSPVSRLFNRGNRRPWTRESCPHEDAWRMAGWKPAFHS
jgi:hypothetical protein